MKQIKIDLVLDKYHLMLVISVCHYWLELIKIKIQI